MTRPIITLTRSTARGRKWKKARENLLLLRTRQLVVVGRGHVFPNRLLGQASKKILFRAHTPAKKFSNLSTDMYLSV